MVDELNLYTITDLDGHLFGYFPGKDEKSLEEEFYASPQGRTHPSIEIKEIKIPGYKIYAEKDIAEIVDKFLVYWQRGDAHSRAELNGDKYRISLKAEFLLKSIHDMRKVPAEVRKYLIMAKADDETLNALEVMCNEDIKKFEKSKR